MSLRHSDCAFWGVEVYKNKPITYSAGRFIDVYTTGEVVSNNKSFVHIANTEDSKIQSRPSGSPP